MYVHLRDKTKEMKPQSNKSKRSSYSAGQSLSLSLIPAMHAVCVCASLGFRFFFFLWLRGSSSTAIRLAWIARIMNHNQTIIRIWEKKWRNTDRQRNTGQKREDSEGIRGLWTTRFWENTKGKERKKKDTSSRKRRGRRRRRRHKQRTACPLSLAKNGEGKI